MFKLIGLTIERKQSKLTQVYEERMARLYQRATKEQKADKLRILLEHQREADD